VGKNTGSDLMVFLNSNLSIMFWNVIFETLRRREEINEPKLVLISPWMSDIEIENSRWSAGALESLRQSLNWDGNFNRLSDVLSAAVNCGIEVQVFLAAKNGKFLRKTSDLMVERESAFISRLEKGGVKCYFKPDFHRKNILSPLAHLSGSANFTVNGLTGKLQEDINWTHIDRESEAYSDVSSSVNMFIGEKFWKSGEIRNLSDFPQPEILSTDIDFEFDNIETAIDNPIIEIQSRTDILHHPVRPDDYVEPDQIFEQPESVLDDESVQENLHASLGALNEQTMTLVHEIGLLEESNGDGDSTLIDMEKLHTAHKVLETSETSIQLNTGPEVALKACIQDLLSAGQMIASGQQSAQQTAKILTRAGTNYATAQRSRSRLKTRIRF